MTEFKAEVIDIREESRIGGRQRWQMMLNHTAFSTASNTGTLEAFARSGTRIEVAVLGVAVEPDGVWHLVEKPLAAGTSVTGHIADSDENGG